MVLNGIKDLSDLDGKVKIMNQIFKSTGMTTRSSILPVAKT
jgi:hypothetical protein